MITQQDMTSNLALLYQDTQPDNDAVEVNRHFIHDCKSVADYLVYIGVVRDTGEKFAVLSPIGELFIQDVRAELPWLPGFVEGMGML